MVVYSSIHLFSFAFSILAFACLSAGKNCETLDGKWYNQLGSEIFLKHENDGRLLGEYRTAAEREKGSAGETHSILLGKYDDLTVYIRNMPYFVFTKSTAMFLQAKQI